MSKRRRRVQVTRSGLEAAANRFSLPCSIRERLAAVYGAGVRSRAYYAWMAREMLRGPVL